MSHFFRYTRGWKYHIKLCIWLKIEGKYREEEGEEAMESLFTCWDAYQFTRIRRRMRVLQSDLDKTPDHYILSDNTVNAEVIWNNQP